MEVKSGRDYVLQRLNDCKLSKEDLERSLPEYVIIFKAMMALVRQREKKLSSKEIAKRMLEKTNEDLLK